MRQKTLFYSFSIHLVVLFLGAIIGSFSTSSPINTEKITVRIRQAEIQNVRQFTVPVSQETSPEPEPVIKEPVIKEPVIKEPVRKKNPLPMPGETVTIQTAEPAETVQGESAPLADTESVKPQQTDSLLVSYLSESATLPALNPVTPQASLKLKSSQSMYSYQGQDTELPPPPENLEIVQKDFQQNRNHEIGDYWSLSWRNGPKRAILSYPDIDKTKLPPSRDRLINVTMSIFVSPQGNVLSAEIQSPGSGDIKIDRYIHSVALQLTMEPALNSLDAPQFAELRFLFRDEGQE